MDSLYTAYITPCPDYDAENVRNALTTAINAVGGLDWVKPGMRIGIKLNLCAARKPEAAATTHPVMASELTKMLIARGATVVLGDSPGEPFNQTVLNHFYSVTGLKAVEEAGGELNHNFSHETVEFPEAVSVKTFEFTSWLGKCDAIINFSKLKSHGLMGMTAATKNLYGIIPGTVKSEYHFRHPDPADFTNMLVDLNEFLKPVLCLCDAVDCMEGNGPTQGTPRHIGALIAGTNPYYTDRLCAAVLGIKEEEIPYLDAAKKRGLLSQSDDETYAQMARDFAVTDFERSGATGSWFLNSPNDKLIRKLMKKGLAAAMSSKPALKGKCTGCGHCAKLCPAHAITIENKKASINRKKCVKCFCCQEFCPAGAMQVQRAFIARLINR